MAPSLRGALYRRAAADAVALSGFTFGWAMVCCVGEARRPQHQTGDDMHQALLTELAALQQTILRREILLLFDASTAVLRAGSAVADDVRSHGRWMAFNPTRGMQPYTGCGMS